VGRGGRRPGAGRKPNRLKRLGIRHVDLIRLSPEEIQALEAIARKLAAPAPDGPHNQIESKQAIEAACPLHPRPSIDGGSRRNVLALEG
jgi:hypothetical protein